MSEQDPGHDHSNHAYSFQICEHSSDWAVGMDEALYWEFKAGLRAELQKTLSYEAGPWRHDLGDLTKKYGLRSLHEIPKRVHRELLQAWLDKLNAKRARNEQLFLSQDLGTYCCFVPPKLWHACAEGEILSGQDYASAQPWLIPTMASKGRTQRIPVLARAEWTCEITRDGRPEPVDSKASVKR